MKEIFHVKITMADDVMHSKNEKLNYEWSGSRTDYWNKDNALSRLYFIYRKKHQNKRHAFHLRIEHILNDKEKADKKKRSIGAKKASLTRLLNKKEEIVKQYKGTLFPDDHVRDNRYVNLLNRIDKKIRQLKKEGVL